MCRNLNDPNFRRCNNPERCTADRARDTVKKAADLTSPAQTPPTPAPLTRPLAEEAEKLASLVKETTSQGYGDNYDIVPEKYAELLEKIDSVGKAVEERAEEIAGITGEEILNGYLNRKEAFRELGDKVNEREKTRKKREQLIQEYKEELEKLSELKSEREAIKARIDGLEHELAEKDFTANAVENLWGEDIDDLEFESEKTEALREELLKLNREKTELAKEMKGLLDESKEKLATIESMKKDIEKMTSEISNEGSRLIKQTGAEIDETKSVAENIRDIMQGKDPKTMSDVRKIATARKEALKELGQMGGEVKLDPSSDPRAADLIREASNYYPTSLIEKANSGDPMVARLLSDPATQSANYIHTSVVKIYKSQDSAYVPKGERHPEEEKGWREALHQEGYEKKKGHTVWELPEYEEIRHPRSDRNVIGEPPAGWEEATALSPRGKPVRIFRKPKMEYEDTNDTLPTITLSTEMSHTHQWQETVGLSTTIHELGHRMALTNSWISMMEKAHVVSRTSEATGERTDLVPHYYGNNQVTHLRPDSFASPYMSREYTPGLMGNDSNGNPIPTGELFTKGMEGAFAGHDGSLIGINNHTPDQRTLNFTLGVLAVAAAMDGTKRKR